MICPIHCDTDGLEQAVRALFEESLAQSRIAGVWARMSEAERDRVVADAPIREISPGYYRRAMYYLNLSNLLAMGIPIAPEAFTSADIAGISAVRAARTAFEREHPACPRCGERQDNSTPIKCHACPHEFRRRA